MKAHSLHRLQASLYCQPQLISEASFQTIGNYLSARNEGLVAFPASSGAAIERQAPVVGKTGFIEMHGPLTYRSTGWEAMCGGTSYQQLLADTEEMLAAGVKLIVMDVDSGGGEGYACFQTANELRKMVDAADARWIAYNDGTTASAAYALAVAADEVISNPSAETGSIGVLVALMNGNKALEKEGYTRTFITAGKSKVPFDKDGDWRPEFLADIQTKVDAMYGQFVEHVASFSGMSAEDVRATEARMFMADDALKLGLINKVMTHSEFIDYIAALAKDI